MKKLIDLTKKLTGNRINLTSFNITLDPNNEDWAIELKTYLFINGGNFHYKEYNTHIEGLDQTLKFIRKEYTLIKEFYNQTPRKTLFPLVLLYDLIDRLEQADIYIDNYLCYLNFDYNGRLTINWNLNKIFTYHFGNFDQAVNETIDYLKEQLN